MDKNAIKKYAVWARRELIARVSQKALRYEITADGCGDANADSAQGTLLSSAEKKQRQALIAQINEKSYEQVMEEVAYTWFNRFSALRFMEVNGYLPSHVRVFTDEDNNFKPQIITEAIYLELDSLNMEKVYALKDENKTDELYKYLLITQCNALSSILPGMFQKLSDYTELLFPENLLREGSVIQQMIELIPEDDWKDAVQIIGWLYQYYNTEPKAEVFGRKSGTKIKKEEIPAATQLFTPDWVVRYMVENSLGRLWVEGHPNDELKAGWKYYLEEAEQEPSVEEQLAQIRKEYESLKPEDIKCIDPCCGSGHILAYLFDVLMQIYQTYGYTTREAVTSIVENNIYGLDIDDRAAQLANFAIMMKARQYDRRFFSHVVQPKVYAIVESNHIDSYTIDYFANSNAKLKSAILSVMKEMHDAKEYGSILTVTPQDWSALYTRFDEIEQDISMYKEMTLIDLLLLVRVAEILSQKYSIVTTNPPYLALSSASEKLYKKMKAEYPAGRNDLYSVFIEKCKNIALQNGLFAMIAQHTWMFLSRSEELRKEMLSNDIVNFVHLGTRAFEEIGGEVVQTATFVFRKTNIRNYSATYIRLVDYATQNSKEEEFHRIENRCKCKKTIFMTIPGTMFIYWQTKTFLDNFNNALIGDIINARVGLDTGNNDEFIRFWHEVKIEKVCFNANNPGDVCGSYKWVPHTKGGSYRKWYGNFEYVLAFDESNYNKLLVSGNHLPSRQFYFLQGMTWSRISTSNFAVRFTPAGMVFNSACPTAFAERDILIYVLGLLNSKIVLTYVTALSPTMNFQAGDIDKVPCMIDLARKYDVNTIVKKNIEISKQDWNAFEVSWDFSRHPLISVIAKNRMLFDDIGNIDLAECFMSWENECNDRFNQLKANEEELNRIFIDIYGLQDELTPEVEDKDVTVRKADLQREVKSLISYAVGCMFGRYSLEKPGLVCAGGDFESVYDKFVPTNQNISDYTHAELSNFSVDELQKPFCFLRESQNKPLLSFHVDADNIIPICSDEYFTDDIVGRFVKFIETVYGKKALDSNLKFIADALGGKGQPVDVIRNYFINDFYADHCKIYQKRPIYWLFDSGKKGGFKALIYMHRYQQDTIARMRTDYVHEQQGRYRTEISDLETRIAGASTSERVKLNKQFSALQDKATEIRQYEETIHHLADQMIPIDLDDGVKNNYAIFQDVLAKIK